LPEGNADLADLVTSLDNALIDALRADLADVPGMPTSNEGLEAEFFARAYQFARSWLQERDGPVEGEKPALLVLSRAIQQDLVRLQTKPRPYFSALPDGDCGGQLLIATPDFSQVAQLQDAAIETIEGAAEALQGAGLHACAHVVFRPDRGELILVPGGQSGTPRRVPITLAPPVRLSEAELERQFWEFHTDFTQTPSSYLNCWRGKASDRVPVEELERQISGMLAFWLVTIVGREHVSMEHYTTHGRVDVALFSAAMAAGLGPSAIELKVLRSRQWRSTSKGWDSVSEEKMVEHAKDGVQQADDYRAKLKGKIAYLCCFDARINDAGQPEVAKLAASKKVVLRRYYMYESQSAYRAARAKADKAGELLSGEVLVAS
jgi:hypothetical protein